jgi:hypothetical protein
MTMTQSELPYDPQAMRERMDAGLAQFLALLDRLSPQQMLGPTDAAGWNARDHVTHLAVWADGIAALLRREERWAAMNLAMSDPEGDEPDYDAMNAQIVVQHRHLSPAEARAWLVAAHQGVLEAMEALPAGELSLPYQRFVAPYTGDWGYPIAAYVLGNTEDHYDEHARWIAALAAPPDA